MKRLIWLLFLLVGMRSWAQYSTVAATVTDSDGQNWTNGTVQVTFVPPIGYNGTIFTFNGAAWTPTVHNYALSPTGVMNATLIERNDYILPANSRWQFKICPNASVTCSSVTLANINQANQNITSQLNLQTVRFSSAPTAHSSYGYADVEVSPVPSPGGFYFNVNTNSTRVWDGTQWSSSSGGGGGGDFLPINNPTFTGVMNGPQVTTDQLVTGHIDAIDMPLVVSGNQGMLISSTTGDINIQSNNSTVNSTGLTKLSNTLMGLKVYNSTTLPNQSNCSSYQNSMVAVSDATTLSGAYVGGGTIHAPVYCDGSKWQMLGGTGGGGGGGTATPAAPNGSYQYNDNGSLGGNAHVLDVASFAGATWDAKVRACLNALYASGGGTCDARSLTGNQTMASSVTVGNASVTTVLQMGTMSLNRASGAQFLVNTNAQLLGAGKFDTMINGDTTIPAVQQAYGAVKNSKWAHFGVHGTGTVTSGVAGIQFGGPNSGIPMADWPGGVAQTGLIGKNNPTGDYFSWPGYIAQFAIYNHVLTDAQVHNHYVVGTTGSNYENTVITDGPIAYYPLKETSGTTAVDLESGRNGTYDAGVVLASANGIPGDTSCGGVCKMPLFPGTSTYQAITLPNYNWISSTDWSVEGWFQSNIPDGTWKRLWHFNDASGNYVNLTQNSSNGGLVVESNYAGFQSQGQIGFNAGDMHHIVITHHTGSQPGIVMYLDGYPIRMGSDVWMSFLDDVHSDGFDIGLQLKSEGGCICYNQISNVEVHGSTYGLDTENVSGYAYGVNSNTFVNGQYGGNVGIFTNGGTVNTFIKPNMEGDYGASYVLNDSNVYMLNPYEEASGPPILNGYGHYVTGFGGDYGGSCWTCTYVSTNRMPDYWAVNRAYLFGKSNHPDSGTGTTVGLYGPTANPYDGIDVMQQGNSVNTYGRYGHAPFRTGPLFAVGGSRISGKSYFLKYGTPATPTAVATGGTGTSYTYYAIGYTIWGEQTLPSDSVTVSGPATLDATHYVTITPPQTQDGIWCWDILKGDTSHVLTVDGTNHCMNLTAYAGLKDTGQAVLAYTPPARDTTGDLQAQGMIISETGYYLSGCPAGTYIKADGSGCANPTGNISNVTLTVGATAIATGTPCAGPYTVSMPGLVSTMTITISPTGDFSTVTGWGPVGGGGLYFVTWPTTDTLNYKVCNASTASITPSSATTWNVSAK